MKIRKFIGRCIRFVDSLPKRLLPQKVSLYLFQHDLLQRHRVVADRLKNARQNRRVLDIGGGSETLADYLPTESYNVVSIDIDFKRCKIAKSKGSTVILCDACWLPFRSNTFDAIVSIHSLEHIPSAQRERE